MDKKRFLHLAISQSRDNSIIKGAAYKPLFSLSLRQTHHTKNTYSSETLPAKPIRLIRQLLD